MKVLLLLLALIQAGRSQSLNRQLDKLTEVFAWKQLTYNINGNMLLLDRFSDNEIDVEPSRRRRQTDDDSIFFDNTEEEPIDWNRRPDRPQQGNYGSQQNTNGFQQGSTRPQQGSNGFQQDSNGFQQGSNRPQQGSNGFQQGSTRPQQGSNGFQQGSNRPQQGSNGLQQGSNIPQQGSNGFQQGSNGFQQGSNQPQQGSNGFQQGSNRPQQGSNGFQQGLNGSQQQQPTTVRPADQAGAFYIQYNNVPMGVERVGDRVFICVPRRRYGIPSTLNYIDLRVDGHELSPALRPYPDYQGSMSLVNVYRTRADQCGRLWMVDTGRLEIPSNHQQLQRPAIVIYDLNTNRRILKYEFKASDTPAENTPTGLASITLDIPDGDCGNAYAYVPDLASYGVIVYSLRDNDSWRHTHNYYSFNPVAGQLTIGGQSFMWNDGIFSMTLGGQTTNGCRQAYFHPLASFQEFSVSTCVLKNRTASQDSNYWNFYSIVGERGSNSQSTMHDYHAGTRVLFYAEVGRDAFSCWNTARELIPSNVAVLAQDSVRLSYPSDVHVTGDEVWVMANKLPQFSYGTIYTDEYNFFVYRGNVRDLISGTTCEH